VTALTVSTDFLRTLRMPPRIGREFSIEETRAGGPQAIMISDGLWRSSFGANENVLGQTITLNDTAFTIVGALPADFWFPQPLEVSFRCDPREAWAISAPIIRLSRGSATTSVWRKHRLMSRV
jgi:hypothetical protein